MEEILFSAWGKERMSRSSDEILFCNWPVSGVSTEDNWLSRDFTDFSIADSLGLI